MGSEEKQAITNLDEKVTKILFHLESDPRTNTKGLVEKFGIMEAQISDLLTREKVYKAKATAWGAVGGFILIILKELLFKILPI